MVQFEMEVLAADVRERTIEGVIVPYGETATIAGRRYRFAAGSLTLARGRTPLLVDHDRSRPVGVLAELVESETGALGRFRIDATADGDTALVQAASGSRGSLSVGADIVQAEERDGVFEVSSALLLETSLLAIGAFPGASVTRVAAQEEPEPAELEEEEEEEEQEEHPDQQTIPVGGEIMTQAVAAPPVIVAARTPDPRELSAGELVDYLIRAQHGERDAVQYIQAALTESISTDVTGLLPPQYETTVIGERAVDRPLYNAFRGRPIPSVGLNVVKPKWTTHTAGAEAANVDADATSTKVTLTTQTATVKRWDWAGAIPWVVVQRSDPSVIDEIYADAVQGFYLYVEGKIGGQLLAAATGTSTTIGAALAEFYIATGNQRTAEVIVMAPDVWGKFADKSVLNSGILVEGVGNLTASLAGIPVVVSGTITAAHTILATRRAVDARVTEPVRLTANAIGALNVELACVGEGLFDTDYPAEILQFATLLPAVAETGSSRSK